jgi:hypothetical protein
MRAWAGRPPRTVKVRLMAAALRRCGWLGAVHRGYIRGFHPRQRPVPLRHARQCLCPCPRTPATPTYDEQAHARSGLGPRQRAALDVAPTHGTRRLDTLGHVVDTVGAVGDNPAGRIQALSCCNLDLKIWRWRAHWAGTLGGRIEKLHCSGRRCTCTSLTC